MLIYKKIADINDDPIKIDLGKVESKIDDEVPTFGEIDSSEEDFILVNGVKYIRSALHEETEFDRAPAVSIEDVYLNH